MTAPDHCRSLERARALVLRWGWNAVAYQILNPGFCHWFPAAGDGVVGYVARRGYWVVGGAPVCAAHRLTEVALEFEAAARRAGCRVCYFGAGLRLYQGCRTPPAHSVVALGAQPVWHPARWAARVESHASLRAQFNRARNKGVRVSEWPPERAEGHPALRSCLSDWLARRPMPPMHFLVEPDTLTFLDDRRVFVAERAGAPVAYLVASPIPARSGWLIEQIIRSRTAPNGTNELLLDAAVRVLAGAGADYVTLGLSPLSRRAEVAPGDSRRNPFWLRLLLGWVRAHGTRFYNFEGLDAFKAKFRPESWEPIFAISTEPRFSPRTLYAIAAAFSDRSPVSQVGRALLKAVRQEWRWFTGDGAS